MTNIYMYDYGSNERNLEIRNPLMLARVSFGAVQKNKMITEPSPDYMEKNFQSF